MHVMSVEYLRPMMGASPSSDQLQQQLSQNTRGHCRPSTREGGKGGAHRARALSAAARGPHLSTRNPRPKESARLGGTLSLKKLSAVRQQWNGPLGWIRNPRPLQATQGRSGGRNVPADSFRGREWPWPGTGQ